MTVQPSLKLTIAGMIAAELIVISAVVAWFLYTGTLSIIVLVMALLAISLVAVPKIIQKRTTMLTLEDGKLRYRAGILSRSSRTMELRKVQDVRVDQTLAQRLLNIGDLSIETAGETSHMTIRGIDRPHHVADEILEASRGGTTRS